MMLDAKKDFQEFLANQDLGDDQDQQAQAASMAQFQAAHIIAAPFLSASGQACLAELRSRTIEQPCFLPGEQDGYGFMREGQNSMVRYIETCIRVAQQGPPNVGQTEPTPTRKSKRR